MPSNLRGVKIIALDLFCGAGGASKGLLDAGFKKVVGVDNKPQQDYFNIENFRLYDAFEYLQDANTGSFDFIWASPPCQAYSYATKKARNLGKKYPNLIGKTRRFLLKTGKPFVIENVVGAPLRKDLVLCGELFGLRIIRHRIFEIHGFKCKQVPHKKHQGKYVTVAGHGGDSGKGNCSLKSWQDAMQIPWITNKKTLAQCVPPKYAEYIGKQFLGNR